MPDVSSEVIELQVRLAELERTLEDLSDTVRDQWQEIDRLKLINTRLVDRIVQMEQRTPLAPGDEPPPPHY